MKTTRGKIVAALWLAGALVGLLAILALPGRWIGSDSAEAHDSTGGPGVEFVDSKATAASGHDNLLCDDEDGEPQKALDEFGVPKGFRDACPFVDPGLPIMKYDLGLEIDTWTDLSLNYDQDGDGKFDTYLLKSGSHARLVVHVTGAFDDVPDGTKVNFDVKEGGVAIIAYSELCGNEPGAGLGTRANLSAGGGDLSFCP